MKSLIAILLTSSLVGYGSEGTAQPSPAKSHPVESQGGAMPLASADYYATFQGKDLGCCIVRDNFHKPPQALQEGTGKAGETAVLTTKEGKLGMELTAPKPILANTTPSMGIFSVGHKFGRNATFAISATFQRPVGTPSGKAWSIGVVGRTGKVDDTAELKRILLSFRTCTTGLGPCAGAKANLRVMEANGADPDDPATVKLNSTNIPDDVFNAIFTSGQPFTLKLFVDRKKGEGVGTITTGNANIPPLPFKTTIFTSAVDSPVVETVGATLASGFAPGESMSVEVSDIAIWAR